MKKTLFNYALIIASALCLSGCEEHEQSHTQQLQTQQLQTQQFQTKVKYYNPIIGVHIYSIEVEGHCYIIFDSHHKGGIIHSESCPCKKKENENE